MATLVAACHGRGSPETDDSAQWRERPWTCDSHSPPISAASQPATADPTIVSRDRAHIPAICGRTDLQRRCGADPAGSCADPPAHQFRDRRPASSWYRSRALSGLVHLIKHFLFQISNFSDFYHYSHSYYSILYFFPSDSQLVH